MIEAAAVFGKQMQIRPDHTAFSDPHKTAVHMSGNRKIRSPPCVNGEEFRVVHGKQTKQIRIRKPDLLLHFRKRQRIAEDFFVVLHAVFIAVQQEPVT